MKKDPNPPRHVKDILGEIKLIPDIPRPESRKQRCALCHLDFLSNPQWFANKWMYPNICVYCGDNHSQIEQVRSGGEIGVRGKKRVPRTELDTALGPKKFYCPGCGNLEKVNPVKDGAYWAYNAQCSQCGVKWVNLYHAYKRKEIAKVDQNNDDDPRDE